MKTLDKYVLKELGVPLVIGVFVFAMLFVANDLIAIYKNFNVDAVPFLAIVQLLVFKFPQWLTITLPIGTALGASLAMSRLSRESEVTAMRASGISVARVVRPVLLAGLLMAVANFLVVEKLVPPASKSYRKLVNEVGILAAIPQFRSNVNISIGRFSASFGSIARGERGLVNLREILLFERPRPGEVIIYDAPSGTYQNGLWVIKSPFLVRLKGTSVVSATTEDDLPIIEPIRVSDLFAPPLPEEEPIESLAISIRENRRAKQSTTKLEIAYHQKFAVPVACLIFAFTGAVLAVRFARAGPFIGVMVSLGLVWLHFNVYVICGEILELNGWLSPMFAAWTPNVVFAVFGLIFVRRME